MTTPLKIVCALVLLPAGCGARTVEDDTDSATEGATSSDGGSSVTIGMTTSMTTAPMTTAPMTTDAVTSDATLDPTGEATAADSSSTGGGGSGCCEVHAEAGCDEETVATCVCDAAPDCCVFGWEKNCVDVAMNQCDATCMGTEESSGSSTGASVGACDDVVEIDLEATDAVLSGGWEIIMSMVGEGMVAAMQQAPEDDAAVHWDIDVPCDDDWYIWVRGTDFGDQDSFLATLDGEPQPAPIFELECTPGGDAYVWTRLNQRDPDDANCEYVEDPWVATWATGTHAFELGFREAQAVARIVVTNDEAFVPR
jgi:hypothetical protein